jgi:spore maturation protein SpmA
LAWASVFVAGLIFAIIAGGSLSTVIAAIFNPEYWALKQVLK